MANANAIGDVSLLGTNHSYNSFTFYANSAMTEKDVGKPAALDTVANTIKVAEDGDKIIGYIEQVEDRELEGIKVATVTTIGFFELAADAGLAVGDSVVGSADGKVKKATEAVSNNYVVEVRSNTVVVRLSM